MRKLVLAAAATVALAGPALAHDYYGSGYGYRYAPAYGQNYGNPYRGTAPYYSYGYRYAPPVVVYRAPSYGYRYYGY
jgi:hypothetical protein